MDKPEDIIRAAACVIVEPILRLLEDDNHYYGTRPFTTCETISHMLNKPFGCVKKK